MNKKKDLSKKKEMGGNTSKNVTEAINKVGIESIMNVIQDNSTVISAINNVNLGPGCSGTIGNINQSIYLKVNTSAVSAAVKQDQFSVAMQNQIQQIALASSQALSFNPASNDAQNYAKAVNALGAKMISNITQNCTTNILAQNNITCSGTGPFSTGAINQGITIDAIKSCVQTATQDTQLQADLTNAIKQSAVAKQESLFGPLTIIIIVVILGVVAVLVFGGKSTSEILGKPWIYLAVLAGLAGFTGVLWYTKKGPFKPNITPADTGKVCGLACQSTDPSVCASSIYQPCPPPPAPGTSTACAGDKPGTLSGCQAFPLGTMCGSLVCQNSIPGVVPWAQYWAKPGTGKSTPVLSVSSLISQKQNPLLNSWTPYY